jgi:hypothetical protein
MTRFILTLALMQAPPAPTIVFAWTQPQTVSTAIDATYLLYIDEAPSPVLLRGVQCGLVMPVGTALTARCEAPVSALPPLTPGRHTVKLAQRIGSKESEQSAAVTLELTVAVKVLP